MTTTTRLASIDTVTTRTIATASDADKSPLTGVSLASEATSVTTTFGDLPQIEGELLKKTKNGTWHPRYFVLQGYELSWRASGKSANTSLKAVTLTSNGDCAVRDIQVGIKKFMFEITLPNGQPSVLLSASGATEKKAWLMQLQLVCTPPAAKAKPAVQNKLKQQQQPAQMVAKHSRAAEETILQQMATTPQANERLVAKMASVHSNPKCNSCNDTVLKMEQVKDVLGEGTVIHRRCFVCSKCKRGLTQSTFVFKDHKLFCMAHARQSVTMGTLVNKAKPQQVVLKKTGIDVTGTADAEKKEESIVVEAQPVQEQVTKPEPVEVAKPVEDPVKHVVVEEPTQPEQAVEKPTKPEPVEVAKPVEDPVKHVVVEEPTKPEQAVEEPTKPEQAVEEPAKTVAEEPTKPEPIAVVEEPAKPEEVKPEPKEQKDQELPPVSMMRKLSATLLPMRRPSLSTSVETAKPPSTSATSFLRRIPSTTTTTAATGPSVKGLGMSLKLNLGRTPMTTTNEDTFADLPPLARKNDLDNTAQLAKPTVPSGRRRKPSMMPGTLLHQPAMEIDRMTSECTFKAKFDDGQTICMYATSTVERDAWVAALCNVIQVLELERLLSKAQKIDMMSAMQCQLDLEHFAAKNQLFAYSGFLEKLSVKSQRNWKKRWFELSARGQFTYSADDKSKKTKNEFQLTSTTQVFSATNELLSGNT